MGDRPNRPSWLLALLGGAAAGWAMAPPEGPLQLLAVPLLWLALALLWGLQERPGARLRSAAWGALAVIVSHRWLLGLHPLDWIGVPLPLSLPLCWLLLLFCGAAAGLLLLLWSSLALVLVPRRLGSALLLAGLWGLAEVLLARSPLFWLGLGAAALPGDPALAGLAALGGAGLVAAVQVLIGWGLWQLLRAGALPLRQRLPAWGGAALLLVGVHGLGALQLQAEPGLAGAAAAALPEATRERVLLVQPAVPTREKQQWHARRRLERQLQAALAAAKVEDADLVVLPEGALGLEPELAEPAAVELISGGFRWQARDGAGPPEQRSALPRSAAAQCAAALRGRPAAVRRRPRQAPAGAPGGMGAVAGAGALEWPLRRGWGGAWPAFAPAGAACGPRGGGHLL